MGVLMKWSWDAVKKGTWCGGIPDRDILKRRKTEIKLKNISYKVER